MPEPSKRYRAFISYSQTDKAQARRLHAALEAYRLPKGTIGENAAKLGRFFRDDDEMGAATDLGASLRGAIEDSESLIVLCSPAAAQSKWVNTEILHFKRTGRADRIFAVIASGKPNASDSGDQEHECFPPALRFEIDASGEPTQTRAEPLAVQLAGQSRPRLLARLAAGLLRISFDELWQRDRRRARTRLVASVGAGTAAIVLLASALGVLVFNQARTASIAQSQALSLSAQTAFEAGHHERALRLAVLAARTGWIARAGPEADVVLAGIAAGSRRYAEFQAHEGSALSVAFSPDGSLIATGGVDGTLRVWDARTLQQIGDDLQDGSWLPSLSFSPDGREIATANEQGVKVWDRQTGQARVLSSLHPGLEQAVSYSADGTRLLAGSILLDRASGRVIARDVGRDPRFGLAGRVFSRVRVGEEDAIQSWDATTGIASQRRPFILNPEIRALAVHGQHLAVATRDGDVTIWDAQTGQRSAPSLPHRDAMANDTASVVHLAFRPDGEVLATAVSSIAQRAAIVRLWDSKTGEQVGAPFMPDGAVSAMAFSPDGGQLALALSTGEIQLLRSSSASLDGLRLPVLAPPEGGFNNEIKRLRFTRNGDLLLISQQGSGIITILNGISGETAYPSISASDFAYSANADVLATTSEYDVTIWDLSDGVSRRSSIASPARAIAVAPDGARIVLATDAEIQLYDLSSGQVQQRAATDFSVTELYFSPTGTVLFAGGFDNQQNRDRSSLLNAASLQPIETEQDGNWRPIFSSAGDQILLAGLGPRVLTLQSDWRSGPEFELNTAAGRRISSSEAGAFSPDGALLATLGAFDWPTVWNVHTGQAVANLPSGDLMTHDIAFSSNGTRVFVTSAPVLEPGGTTRIWDTRTQSIVGRPFRHRDTPRAFAMSDDGSRLVVGEQDGAAVMWDVSLASANGDVLIDRVCAERLNGPTEASGTPTVRQISESDAQALPSLRPTIGADVCRIPSLFEEIRDAITLVLAGGSRR